MAVVLLKGRLNACNAYIGYRILFDKLCEYIMRIPLGGPSQ